MCWLCSYPCFVFERRRLLSKQFVQPNIAAFCCVCATALTARHSIFPWHDRRFARSAHYLQNVALSLLNVKIAWRCLLVLLNKCNCELLRAGILTNCWILMETLPPASAEPIVRRGFHRSGSAACAGCGGSGMTFTSPSSSMHRT